MDFESVVEYGPPRPVGAWTRLCEKVGIDTAIIHGDRAAKDEADRAAWHVNKSTDLPTRVRRLARGRYVVEAQIPDPSPCDECGARGTESYPGEHCPCEDVLREVA